MKSIIFFLLISLFSLQAQTLELQPDGYADISIPKPDFSAERILEQTRYWVSEYNRSNPKPYEIFQMSSNVLVVEAYKNNAFFYRNKGETFQHRIQYRIRLDISDSTITYKFQILGIYDNEKRLELTTDKFFTSEGKIKSDYKEAKPSLDRTANAIYQSLLLYLEFMH